MVKINGVKRPKYAKRPIKTWFSAVLNSLQKLHYATRNSKKEACKGVSPEERLSAMDKVVLSFADIVSQFGVSAGAVRAWIAAGRLDPVARSGRGRGGAMLFARGAVVELVYGRCRACGEGFKRVRLSQEFCSSRCRGRYGRASRSA